jgi:hypothetical protein
VEANSTGGQGSRRAVAPSDDDDELFYIPPEIRLKCSKIVFNSLLLLRKAVAELHA